MTLTRDEILALLPEKLREEILAIPYTDEALQAHHELLTWDGTLDSLRPYLDDAVRLFGKIDSEHLNRVEARLLYGPESREAIAWIRKNYPVEPGARLLPM
ncbi:MAG: hypothetical protein OEY14_05990 [Myxococcales bacterium]|nr:hypothetical protein [Myxococcales bacterium]